MNFFYTQAIGLSNSICKSTVEEILVSLYVRNVPARGRVISRRVP